MHTATGADRTPADELSSDDGQVGVCVLDLDPGRALQTCIPRGCDLVLLSIAGRARLDDDVVLGPGQVVLWPRGAPLAVQGLSAEVRLGVVAVPAGADQLFAELHRGDLPSSTLVALAADCGVELLLP